MAPAPRRHAGTCTMPKHQTRSTVDEIGVDSDRSRQAIECPKPRVSFARLFDALFEKVHTCHVLTLQCETCCNTRGGNDLERNICASPFTWCLPVVGDFNTQIRVRGTIGTNLGEFVGLKRKADRSRKAVAPCCAGRDVPQR